MGDSPGPATDPRPVGARNTQVFDGAHGFSINTANLVGGDQHIHYSTNGDEQIDFVDVMAWLNRRNYRQYHAATVSLRAAKTGSWFFETEEYSNWFAAEHGTLWIIGMPGAGKTILASHAVDRLTDYCRNEPPGETSLAYIYCRYMDECTAGDILRTFLRQLGESQREVYPIVQKLYKEHRRFQTRLPDPAAIQALDEAIKLFNRTVFIVDGLDELSHEQIGRVLRSLKTLSVHLLVFSRRLDTFKVLLPSVKTLSIEAPDRDIEAFVLDRIGSNHRLHTLLQHDRAGVHDIVRKIQSKSSGMFLAAALQVEVLAESTNTASLMAALESIPSGLEAMYDWTLRRIEAQSQEEVSLAKRALLWLTFAKSPLRVIDLQCALATSYDTGSFNSASICPVEIILTACGGLVSADGPELCDDARLKLIHHAAGQHLQKITDLPFSAHGMYITFTCLVYIHSALKEDPALEGVLHHSYRYPQYSFLPYAVLWWQKHLEAMDLNGSALSQFCDLIQKFTFLPCNLCRSRLTPDPYHTPSQLAICLDRIDILQQVEFRDNTPAGSFTALHLAIHLNRCDAFSELINGHNRSHIDVNAPDMAGRTPLIHAFDAISGHTGSASQEPSRVFDILDTLLAHPDVDLNLPDTAGRLPVYCAMHLRHAHGRDLLAKLLRNSLRNHMSPSWEQFPSVLALEEMSDGGFPLLIQAAVDRFPEAVRLLLARPDIDINVCKAGTHKDLRWLIPSRQVLQDIQSPPALSWTSHPLVKLCHATLTIVCHTTVDPSMVSDEEGRTPLILAAEFGLERSVRTLLPSKDPACDIDINTSPRAVSKHNASRQPTVPTDTPNKLTFALNFIPHWLLRPFGATANLDAGDARCLHTVEANVNARDRQGMTALFLSRTSTVLQLLLSSPEVDVNIQDIQGNTVLNHACRLNNFPVAKALLLRPDISLGIANSQGITPFISAAANTHGESAALLRLLVQHTNFAAQVELNRVDNRGMSALHYAIRVTNKSSPPKAATWNYLLSHPWVNVNLTDGAGDAPIHILTIHDSPGVMSSLLNRRDIDVNLRNGRGDAPIHVIAQLSRIDSAALSLLQHPELDIHQLNQKGDCAIHIAARGGDGRTVDFLLQHPESSPNILNRTGHAPIHIAARSSQVGVALCLLSSADFDINLQDAVGDSALHIAAEYGDTDMIQTLSGHYQFDSNVKNSAGHGAIHLAARFGRVEAAAALVGLNHLKINMLDRNGNSALHIAAEQGNARLVQALLVHTSLELNMFNGNGYTALHLASRISFSLIDHPVDRLMSDRRLDVNVRDAEGHAVIDILSTLICPTPTVALRMLSLHAQLETNPTRNRRSFYSLCLNIINSKTRRTNFCRRRADWRRIRAILQQDPPAVNFIHAEGKTVLHHAAKGGCQELVAFILEEFWVWGELDETLRDDSGYSAIDYARVGGYDGIVNLLHRASSFLSLVNLLDL